MKKIMIILSVIATAFLLAACGKKTLNINEYVKVTFGGYNTIGWAEWEYDEEALKEFFSKSDCDYEKLLLDCVWVELENTDHLSNGQEVRARVSCDTEKAEEFYGIKLQGQGFTKTVEGLEEAEIYHPFDDLVYFFYGVEPNGQLIKWPKGEGEIDCFTFTVEEYVQLEDGTSFVATVPEEVGTFSNGDPVTIRPQLTITEGEFLKKYNKVPDLLPLEITASGIAVPIVDLRDIPREILEEKLQNEYEKIRKSRDEKLGIMLYMTLENKEIEYCGFYTFVENETGKGIVYMVFRVTGDYNGNKKTIYKEIACRPGVYETISETSEASYTLNSNEVSEELAYKSIDDALNSAYIFYNDEEYTLITDLR